MQWGQAVLLAAFCHRGWWWRMTGLAVLVVRGRPTWWRVTWRGHGTCTAEHTSSRAG